MKKHLAHLAAALAVTLLFGAAAGPLSAAAAAPTAILDEENTAAAESRLNQSWLDLEIEYNDLHPVYQLYLSSAAPDDWVYQWYSTNPAVATVDRNGLVTAQKPGKATIVANTYTTTLRCDVTVVSNVGRVTLNQERLYLEGIGGTAALKATVAAENGSAVPITWTSSNASVATVDGNGCVTGWSQGTAIITARSAGGSVGSCIVYVDEASQLNTSVLSMEIEYNNPQPRSQLYLKSRNGYDDVLQWRSSNPAVVSVDRNGNLTAYQEGTATIYATTYRSGTLSCTVTVQNNIGRVTLNKSCMYLESIGAQGALRAKVAVANPEAVPITWTSSNTDAAVVDANGNVTAVGDGQAVITATSAEGRCASCKVYTGSVGAQKKKKADSFFGLGGLFQKLFQKLFE